jgi:hypothetical protein
LDDIQGVILCFPLSDDSIPLREPLQLKDFLQVLQLGFAETAEDCHPSQMDDCVVLANDGVVLSTDDALELRLGKNSKFAVITGGKIFRVGVLAVRHDDLMISQDGVLFYAARLPKFDIPLDYDK